MRARHWLWMTILVAGLAVGCDAGSPETDGAPAAGKTPKLNASIPQKSGDAPQKSVNASGFSIHLLQNGELELPDVEHMPLTELKLAAEPWIASSDIECYDVSTHCIHLKRPLRKLGRTIASRGMPFVVCVDGEPCYLGAFWGMGSSSSTPAGTPIINSPGWFFNAEDLVTIGGSEKKLRDPRIVKALKRDGQFRAGLACTLDSVEVTNASLSSYRPLLYSADIKYTYTLRNLDDEDYWVVDPHKMEPDYFRGYQNGIISLVREGGEDAVRIGCPNPLPNAKPLPRPWNEPDPAWYTLLKAKDSMTRTVIEDRFSIIPQGEYTCTFLFGSPGYGHGFTGKISKEQRAPQGKRLWIGKLTAEAKAVVEDSLALRASWGELVDAMQLRLRTSQPVVGAGLTPVFQVDLRSNVPRSLPHGPAGDDFEVSVDGEWYKAKGVIDIRSVGPSTAARRLGIHLALNERVWQSKDKGEPLKLAPGKHIVQVAYPVYSEEAGGKWLRVISNPLEIEMQEIRRSKN